jgi:glycerophosphoryl diester phosphodiesterase
VKILSLNKISKVMLEDEVKNRIDKIDGIESSLAENVQQNIMSKFSYKEIKRVGHRGLSKLAPENTLPSFEAAGRYGMWGCETDIHLTSDGQWVTFHDPTVDRMTNGTGSVSSMTLSQLKALTIDAGSNIALYNNLKIPTFEQYLQICKKWEMVAIVELKHTVTSQQLESLFAIINKYNMIDKIILQASGGNLFTIREVNKEVTIGVLANPTDENIAYVTPLKDYMFVMSISAVTVEDMQKVHELGRKVMTYTINNGSDYGKCVTSGVDFFMTDILI